MKTYVVRQPHTDWAYVTNAETYVEAVQYALARTNQLPGRYMVFDHDLNSMVVMVTAKDWNP